MHYVHVLTVFPAPTLRQVRYLFGWSEEEEVDGHSGQLCHPLCVCEECTRLRKVETE